MPFFAAISLSFFTTGGLRLISISGGYLVGVGGAALLVEHALKFGPVAALSQASALLLVYAAHQRYLPAMNPLAWLLARLRRPQPTPSAPIAAPASAVPAAILAAPQVALPPPTATQRLARTQARSQGFGQYVATSPCAANPWPAELRRLNMELTALRFDLAEAQSMSWVEDELHLHLELQRAAAELQLLAWQHALIEQFGPEVGSKLSQHQIEVGMSWEHLVFSYGPPPTGAITLLGKKPTHLAVQYGSRATGSYFELVDDVVTVARLGLPSLAAYLVAALEL